LIGGMATEVLDTLRRNPALVAFLTAPDDAQMPLSQPTTSQEAS
jgi:hypothetical protein